MNKPAYFVQQVGGSWYAEVTIGWRTYAAFGSTFRECAEALKAKAGHA